jgi:proteasome accessory factor B
VTPTKVERLINLLILLLESPEPVTAEEIGGIVPGYNMDKPEAFKRMFERDKEELREMGIPLEMAPTDVWELQEGYVVVKERFYLENLRLEPDEVAALWLASGLLRIEDPSTARSALLKLGGDRPEDGSELPWLTVDLSLTAPGLDRTLEAVTERRTLTFNYRRPAGPGGDELRTLDPYGLVHRRGVWYVVGRDHDRDAIRSFRLDRMADEPIYADRRGGGDDFEAPKDFRPEHALEAPPFVTGEQVALTARIRFSPSIAWMAERNLPWLEMESQEDGAAVAEVDVTDVHGFVTWALWYAEDLEILGPEPLRSEMLRRLEEICA